MIAQFGEIVFEVSADKVKTIKNLSRERKATFASHTILNNKPKLQQTGYELDTISFEMQLVLSHGVSPKTELETLSNMLQAGEQQPFFLGDELLGEYVLESFTETYLNIDNKGNVFSANVSLSLREYI